MKKLNRILTLLGIVCAATSVQLYAETASNNAVQESSQEVTEADRIKISEAFGHFIGRNINSPGFKFDVESLIKGVRDGAAGKPAPMSDKEYEEKMMLLQKIAFNKTAEQNLKNANEFLEKNASEANIVVIEPKKLQYIILKEGHGPIVEEGGSPLIHYKGTLLDGTVFGSSEEIGSPITLPLDQTIPGFSKGIQGMKEGEKRRLFVHPDLGYGTMGHFPPNSLLIFEVEVIKASSPKEDEDDEDEALTLALGDDEDENEDESGETDEKEKGNTDKTPAPNKK